MTLAEKIRDLAAQYADRLKKRINERVAAMEEDDQSHTMIYQVLGVSDKEGKTIDVYQNKDRFLYKYAGSLRIQQTLETLYEGTGGRYYFGDEAWEYVRHRTGFNLKSELESIAREDASL